jgi:hypothetical protein
MPILHIIGVLLLLQVAACATISPAPEAAAAQGGTVVVERLEPLTQDPRQPSIDAAGGTVIIERLPPLAEVEPQAPVATTTPVSPVVAPVPPPMKPAVVAPVTPAAAALPVPVTPAATASPVATAPAISPSATTVSTPAKTTAKPPVKTAVPVVRTAPPQKPAAPARVAAPTLDLDSLEKRLKDTDAIGIFTKITLKNMVDDLLKGFKAYHESDGKTSITQLRQSYDQLLLKVNDLLKSGDPSLAGEIMASREAIWVLLSDPVKFAKL